MSNLGVHSSYLWRLGVGGPEVGENSDLLSLGWKGRPSVWGKAFRSVGNGERALAVSPLALVSTSFQRPRVGSPEVSLRRS